MAGLTSRLTFRKVCWDDVQIITTHASLDIEKCCLTTVGVASVLIWETILDMTAAR